ncbi:MAG: DUF4625 domain-containing protein [Bacteroidia bacterium]
MKSLLLLITSIWLLQFTSCTPGDNDVEPPLIEILNSPTIVNDTICGSPTNNVMILSSGDSLSIGLKLKDNDLLSQLKLDIHDNFDCHGHAQKTTDWNIQKLFDFTGNQTILNISEAIPQHVTAGAYHLIISLLDVSGNEAEPLYFSLKVLNKEDVVAPTLVLNNPYIHKLSVDKEAEFNLGWTMSDNKALNGSQNSKCVLKYLDVTSGNSFTIAELVVDDTENILSKDFTYKYIIPKTWISGRMYNLQIWGYDAVNNLSNPEVLELTIN